MDGDEVYAEARLVVTSCWVKSEAAWVAAYSAVACSLAASGSGKVAICFGLLCKASQCSCAPLLHWHSSGAKCIQKQLG